ncbi:Clp protease [Auraticoccus sp. F435]|uniref:Clp protease n=1 Tax=Auraticoccus cholistanensis TaxID=2656650 RepID=A0A6A9UPT5_9ACTN|nr:Clp protease N-terminal domain-containing protein [Auraticoccus cholistanensis]MVA74733.1 Clp protease [Auraticoccus cholistanensis]
MFERFTRPARRVVVLAQEDARARGQQRVRTENLLVALFDAPGLPESSGAAVLRSLGLGAAAVREAVDRFAGPPGAAPDAERLASLGIDLDAVRRQVEESFGPGALERTVAGRRGPGRPNHVPFDAASKSVLEQSLREALALRDRHIGTEHVLLGLALARGGAAAHVLAEAGVTVEVLREAVRELRRQAG